MIRYALAESVIRGSKFIFLQVDLKTCRLEDLSTSIFVCNLFFLKQFLFGLFMLTRQPLLVP